MDIIKEKDIEKLIKNEEKPCISIYMATKPVLKGKFNKISLKFKNLIKETRSKLKEDWDYNEKEAEELLKPALEIVNDRDFWQNQSKGLAVFISPGSFLYYRLPLDFKDRTFVSRYFNIKQLVPEIRDDRKFYVLALSKNDNRLFRCTRGTIDEQKVDGIPASIDETLKYDDPEKSLQLHTHQSGRSAAIFHGQGVTDEDGEEDLLRYLRQIDYGLYGFLHREDAPLILYCVDELFSLFKSINKYPQLMDQFIPGNPDRLKPEKIHQQALKIAEPYFQKYKYEVVKKYNALQDTDKVSDNLYDIVPASHYSRVDYILLKKDSVKSGKFSPRQSEVVLTGDKQESYDLYNYAAIETIKHGGSVYVLEEDKMPENTEIGAVYRFNM